MTLTLSYFGIYGRGEAARMILTYGKVDFIDKIVTKEQLGEMKAAGKCQQLPILEYDDKVMNQSEAIARYCAIKAGMYNSNNPEACWRDDSIINTITDFANSMPKSDSGAPVFFCFFAGQAMAQEDCDKLAKWTGNNAAKMAVLLGEDPFFGGAKPTLGDFWYAAQIFSFARNTMGGQQAHVYEAVNNSLPAPISTWADRMAEEMKDYLANRPAAPM
mmetsp:Transcript_23158/g.26610  ORF Transcript_23158/g.26610 Transcript_23158/m.26610 type:complete len:217 (+) Transcript_23158:109-759(+)